MGRVGAAQGWKDGRGAVSTLEYWWEAAAAVAVAAAVVVAAAPVIVALYVQVRMLVVGRGVAQCFKRCRPPLPAGPAVAAPAALPRATLFFSSRREGRAQQPQPQTLPLLLLLLLLLLLPPSPHPPMLTSPSSAAALAVTLMAAAAALQRQRMARTPALLLRWTMNFLT